MSDEVQNLAEVPAPELEVTATPEPVETPITPEEQPAEQPAEAPKMFTQEELDAAIGKRLAREQRKWERAQQLKPQQSPQMPMDAPNPDYFDTAEAYAEALAERKAQEIVQQREYQRQQADVLEAYHEREEDARAKYDDFEQVAYNPRLPISEAMAQTIQASDIGPEIAYYLGSNPKEADRIFRMPALMQAKEIGKIESKIATNPPVAKSTSAPPPITPVTSRSSGNPTYDTTDPRSIKTMSTSEWIEADRQRQIRKMEAQRNR